MTTSFSIGTQSGRRTLLGAGFAALLASTSLAGAGAAEPVVLQLYSAQHGATMRFLAEGFTAKTGIKVEVHNGEAPETADTIIKAGSNSPADVYITENSPEMMLVEQHDLLAPLRPTTLAEVPDQFNSPDGKWVGILLRESALVYNTDMAKPGDLPPSIMDFAKPAWKGRVAMAPGDVDFLPLTTAVTALKGKEAAEAWLSAIKANAVILPDDDAVTKAVDAGQAAVGVINGFFWDRFRNEHGADKVHSALYHFKDGDPGALINVTGAAVMKSSSHQAEAQQFLDYIVSRPVQAALAQSDVDFEYPAVAGVPAHPTLKPLGELQPPRVSVKMLGDDTAPAAMLRGAGLM